MINKLRIIFLNIDESNEVPNQSGRSDTVGHITTRRNLEQQSSEATSSGNNLRAQSASITSNQSSMQLQFSRRPSIISPLNRQQNQQLLLVCNIVFISFCVVMLS